MPFERWLLGLSAGVFSLALIAGCGQPAQEAADAPPSSPSAITPSAEPDVVADGGVTTETGEQTVVLDVKGMT